MHYYAYFVMVNGKKRHGGCLHAESMDDAARKVARQSKLTISTPSHPDHEPRLELDGKRASLAVWAIPSQLNL